MLYIIYIIYNIYIIYVYIIYIYIYMGTRELMEREADEVSTSELMIEHTVGVPVLFLQEGMEACLGGKGTREGGIEGGREGAREEGREG